MKPALLSTVALAASAALTALASRPVTHPSTLIPHPSGHAVRGIPDDQGIEFFESRVRPLLAAQCNSCHGPKSPSSGLQLDTKAGRAKGGIRGALMKTGDVDGSLLVKAVRYTELTLRMPPRGKMKPEEIADLEKWVRLGMPSPEDKRVVTPAPAPVKNRMEALSEFWCYKPVVRSAVPKVKNATWARGDIDRFLLAKLESAGLQPAPEADRRTLIRRLSFDLIGLPPTPEEVEAFVADSQPKAYERLVDRLLASPHYGERWARHWLDLVRYCETLGHEYDFDLFNAWRYRDYVIRAMNADLPYDKFVTEHLAGDLLPNPRRHPTEDFNESVIGTGFWWMGEGKHSPVDVRQEQIDRIDNMIDVFGKAFLGQTVACARCHDHKFDPIAQKEYYALAGYLRSSRYQQAYLDGAPMTKALETARRQQWELRSASGSVIRDAFNNYALDAKGRPAWLDTLVAAESKKGIASPFYALAALAAIPESEVASQTGVILHSLEDAERRAEQQRNRYTLFEDFRSPRYEGWWATGQGFGSGPTNVTGDVAVLGGKEPRLTVIPGGVAHSGSISTRFEGVLRSRTFNLDKRFVWIRAAGKGARVNVVLDGFALIRDPIYGPCTIGIDDPKMAWRRMDMGMWKGHHAFIELIDSTIPNLTMGDAAEGDNKPSDDWIGVSEIRFSDEATAPDDGPHPMNLAVLRAIRESSFQGVLKAYTTMISAELERISPANSTFIGSRDSARVAEAVDTLSTTMGKNPKLGMLVAKFLDQQKSIPAPICAPALADGNGEDEDVFLRGNYKTAGEKAPRGLLKVCAGVQPAAPTTGSGRLELAARLTSTKNPLFARVLVNRLWKHHFGEGIVKSVDDFGHMGRLPTHPELLDYLAGEFIKQGYSLKAMHRLMVTSSAYRMQSNASAVARAKDPDNLLLHEMRVRRLEAEAIRDNMLACSGRLNRTAFGPGVYAFINDFTEGRGRPEVGPMDGDGRRSVYVRVRRNFLTPMFQAFDFPTPFSCMGRRSVSNVPAQALTLMNGPFVVQQARVWADQLLKTKVGDEGGRIDRLYRTAFSRPATNDEQIAAQVFLMEQAKRYGCPTNDPRVWTDLCHVTMNVKEFIFVP